MDAVIVIVVVFTAVGLMMLLFCSNPGLATSLVCRCQCTHTTDDRPGQAGAMLLALSDIGDPAGNLIWSTQIPALRFVCDHEPQGAFCADLKPSYLDLARHYPEICDGHNFHDWGQLLLDLNVFRVEGKRVHITPAGRALLEMLLTTRRWRAQDLVRVD